MGLFLVRFHRLPLVLTRASVLGGCPWILLLIVHHLGMFFFFLELLEAGMVPFSSVTLRLESFIVPHVVLPSSVLLLEMLIMSITRTTPTSLGRLIALPIMGGGPSFNLA